MESLLTATAITCPLIFLGGMVDAIAGGGGLISLPTYLLAGLPVHMAYGTNKFSSCLGTSFATIRYLRHGKIHLRVALFSVVSALVGSFLGARAALALDEKYLQYCLIVLLPVVAIVVVTRRRFGEGDRAAVTAGWKVAVLATLSGLVIGGYDGFFGPGTGTFLILIYASVLGFNLTTASGTAKIVNLASNVAALATFGLGGQVAFLVGIPAALCGILGNWIGSGLAIRRGARIIRPTFISVLVLLFSKISYDLLRS